MSKILVIGSNSFSGASFCRYLLDNGQEVMGVSRSAEPDAVMLPYRWSERSTAFEFHRIDLNTDLDALFALIRREKPALIANFAAQSMVGESWTHPEDWMRTNVMTVASFAQRLTGIDFLDRYLHVTTPEVYGSTDGWVKEDCPFNPSTPYAVSRAAGDMLFNIYREQFKLPIVSTRAANVYGPGQQLYRIIPRTIYFLMTGRKLHLHGGGVSTRSFIHMDDVSSASWLLMRNGKIGETYHISTDRIITIRQLVEDICDRIGKSFEACVEVSEDRIGKDSAYWLNSEKLRQELGWCDRIGLEDGIDAVSKWIADNKDALLGQPLTYQHKA